MRRGNLSFDLLLTNITKNSENQELKFKNTMRGFECGDAGYSISTTVYPFFAALRLCEPFSYLSLNLEKQTPIRLPAVR